MTNNAPTAAVGQVRTFAGTRHLLVWLANSPPTHPRTPRISMEHLISAAAIPGVALAVVERGQVNVITMGVRERGAARQVGEATVFDVASLSKPVVAYVALQLVDAGILDLDAHALGTGYGQRRLG